MSDKKTSFLSRILVYNSNKNAIISTLKQRKNCKYCGGEGWHNSSVGKKMIKCPRCSGTGYQKITMPK